MTSSGKFIVFLAGLAVASGTGCISGVNGRLVRKADQEGLRYFLAAPYLVVTEAGGGQWEARFEVGVDRSREFTLKPYNWMAINHAVVEFQPDGTLKSFTLTQDSDDIPVAVVEAIRDVGLQAAKLQEAEIEAERASGQAQARVASAYVKEEAAAGERKTVERRSYVFRIDGGAAAPEAGFASMLFKPAKSSVPTPQVGKLMLPCKDAKGGAARPCTSADIEKLGAFRSGRKVTGAELKWLRAKFTLDKDKLAVRKEALQGIDRILLGVVEIWKNPKS